jgi:hypothetical protein
LLPTICKHEPFGLLKKSAQVLSADGAAIPRRAEAEEVEDD